ncbi:hypothetical protein D3C72_2204680 [compost metagenome]
MTKVGPVIDAGGQVQQHVARARVGDGKAVLAAQDLALACGRKREIAVVGACQAQAVVGQRIQPGILPAERGATRAGLDDVHQYVL